MSKILATELYENNYTHAIISGDICRLNKILQKYYKVECLFTDLDYNKFIIVVNTRIFILLTIPNSIFQSINPSTKYLNLIMSRKIHTILLDDPARKGTFQRSNRWVANMISSYFIKRSPNYRDNYDYVIALYF